MAEHDELDDVYDAEPSKPHDRALKPLTPRSITRPPSGGMNVPTVPRSTTKWGIKRDTERIEQLNRYYGAVNALGSTMEQTSRVVNRLNNIDRILEADTIALQNELDEVRAQGEEERLKREVRMKRLRRELDRE